MSTYYTIEGRASAKHWGKGSQRYSDMGKAVALAKDLDEHGNDVRVREHTADGKATTVWSSRSNRQVQS